MLSKCANPGCPATFLYLHQGKLFRLDTSVEILAVSRSAKRRGLHVASNFSGCAINAPPS